METVIQDFFTCFLRNMLTLETWGKLVLSKAMVLKMELFSSLVIMSGKMINGWTLYLLGNSGGYIFQNPPPSPHLFGKFGLEDSFEHLSLNNRVPKSAGQKGNRYDGESSYSQLSYKQK